MTDARLVRQAAGLLGEFNEAGVLDAADVHVALRLGRLTGATDEEVLLAAALAVRAPRLGHVRTDLATIAATADTDAPLDWPDPARWTERVRTSELTGPDRPLRLEGTALYLDRYWAEEVQVAEELLARAAVPAGTARAAVRLFPDEDLQRAAASTALNNRLTVIAGGPGTGKTTTVARVLALIDEEAVGRPPLIALSAPTGKASARLEETVHEQARAMDIDDGTRARLLALQGTTLHRLLGSLPGTRTRFRHNRLNRLPHDVVVIDETSMVSLSHMARLLDAVRPDARLILVGDPQQLASVEAGAVLGDIVGPATVPDPPRSPIARNIVVLRRVHRFGESIGNVADAIRAGDAARTVALLGAGDEAVRWIDVDVSADAAVASLDGVRNEAVAAGRRVRDAAADGDAAAALAALGSFRLLCAHRHGPAGAETWMGNVERWLATGVGRVNGDWYAGRPLLVTRNDYSLQLFNGDTGVVVAKEGGRLAAAFERRGEIIEVSPARLAAVETVYAMTVHKAQGSQFDSVVVMLPEPASPILTRELLYTAVSRARQRVTLVGTSEAIGAAVERPIARASGLGDRLWAK